MNGFVPGFFLGIAATLFTITWMPGSIVKEYDKAKAKCEETRVYVKDECVMTFVIEQGTEQ